MYLVFVVYSKDTSSHFHSSLGVHSWWFLRFFDQKVNELNETLV